MKKALLLILFLGLLLAFMASCGGAGGGSDTGSSNWDDLVWDQDNWA